MKANWRIGAVGAALALLSLSGCVNGRGEGRRDEGRENRTERPHEERSRDDADCAGRGADEQHCRDEHSSNH